MNVKIKTTSILASTIIGAGIFALPYVYAQIGLITGIIYLTVFTIIYITLHQMYFNVLNAQNSEHQIAFLFKKYLQYPYSFLSTIIILLKLIFVLTVYLILSITFSQLIFIKIPPIYLLFIFWALSSIFIFVKISTIGFAESIGIFSMIAIVLIIMLFSFQYHNNIKLIANFNLSNLLTPFGLLLFALSGRPAIHKVLEELKTAKNKNNIAKKSIILGTTIPAILYLIFVIGVLKINPLITPETLNSLSLSPIITIFLAILGLIVLWTSYFVVGANIYDMLRLDFKIKKYIAALSVLSLPIIFYFLGFNKFLPTLNFVSGIFLGLEGILIIRLWQKAFPQHKLYKFSWLLYIIFIISISVTIISRL
ncbi:MAG: aromatic amino acid transport family protein [Minisyncoccia bacterium]